MSNTKIVRLNASALYALGMDRPTVEALINSIRVTGNDAAGVTVPELSGQVGQSDTVIRGIQQDILLIQISSDSLATAPLSIPDAGAVDESWKVAPPRYEQVMKEQAPVDESWRLNPIQPIAISDRIDNLETEIRQVAEQVAVLLKMIQEDRSLQPNTQFQDQTFLLSEVRQVAERQTQVMTLIDELKQGTML